MPDPNAVPADDGVISLKPFLKALWNERRRIAAALALAAVVYSIGAVAYYLTRPFQRTARVEFRILFDGADRGEYPNGSRFAAADFIAASVLEPVFQKNDLARFLSYERFKNGLWIFQSSRELDFLNYEYQAKLADTKLVAVERSRIEAEFKQKLAALTIPQLSLHFEAAGRSASPPSQLMEKVLNDVLAEWAEQTASKRGALGYQIELLTPSAITADPMSHRTMLIRYDVLRQHVDRVVSQIGRLAGLPGANAIRVGESRLSLLDLRSRLQDLRDFQLTPLVGTRALFAPSSAEASINLRYLEGRLVELKRFKDTEDQRKLQLETALQAFTSESPAPGAQRPTDGGQGAPPIMSDNFLDRVIDIAQRSNATDYRTELTNRIIGVGDRRLSIEQEIAFYEEARRVLMAASAGRSSELNSEDLNANFDEIQAAVVKILQLTNDAYETISTLNLNPAGVLYAVTGPFSLQTQYTVTPRYLAMTGLVFLLVAGALIALGLTGFALFRQYRLSAVQS